MSKINKVNKSVYITMLLILAMLFTCGCTIKYHTENDAKRQEAAGKPIVEEYLSTICDSYEILSCEMVEGRPKGYPLYASAYESDYVYCKVLINENKYNIYVNTKTKEVWSDYYGYLINNLVKKQLKPICESHGLDSDIIVLAGAYNQSMLYDGPDKLTLEVTINSCLPAAITPETISNYSGDYINEMKITGLAIGYSSDVSYDELAKIADDYYLQYQADSYAKFDAGFATYKISEADIDRLNSEAEKGYIDFASVENPDYIFFSLMGVESETGISEIFWKYKIDGEENFNKYIVYEEN